MKKYSTQILLILIIAIGGLGIYFYQKSVGVNKIPDPVAQKEAADLVSRVGKLILLPKDEIPTVAKVNDPEKLKSQSFFAKAKAGDIVLFYQNRRVAYLYDPLENKIIQVAPITFETNTPAVKSSKTTSVKTSKKTVK